jgi:hypothetical protein
MSAPLLSCGTLASRAGCSGHLRPCSRPDSSLQVRVERRKPGHRRGAKRRSPPLAECWLYSNFAAQRERPRRRTLRRRRSTARRQPARRSGLDQGRSPRPTRRRARAARVDPGGVAPRGSAMPRGRRACDRTRPGPPCTWGMAALAIRVRCGAPTVSLLLDAPTAVGTLRVAPLGMSDTSPRARERGRLQRPPRGAERPCGRCDPAPLGPHRADPEVRRRRLGGDPCQPWRFGRRIGEGSASTPRPLDRERPYFGHNSRTFRFAAVCRDFVPIRERP